MARMASTPQGTATPIAIFVLVLIPLLLWSFDCVCPVIVGLCVELESAFEDEEGNGEAVGVTSIVLSEVMRIVVTVVRGEAGDD